MHQQITDDSWLLPKECSETPPIPTGIVIGLLGPISLGTAVLSVLFSESHSRHGLLKTICSNGQQQWRLLNFVSQTHLTMVA